MSLKALQLRTRQLLIEGIAEKSIELLAAHPVSGFFWHHITCL